MSLAAPCSTSCVTLSCTCTGEYHEILFPTCLATWVYNYAPLPSGLSALEIFVSYTRGKQPGVSVKLLQNPLVASVWPDSGRLPEGAFFPAPPAACPGLTQRGDPASPT
jgi:hypothetical protein